MRDKQSYINKYGKDYGEKLYSCLQKEAAHASLKAKYKNKFRLLREQVKRLGDQPCA